MYDELQDTSSGSGISYRRLSAAEGRCLVLFYREKELSEYVNRVGIRSFIREFGYIEMGLDEMLERLSCRTALFSREEIGYPHEIGIFLEIPWRMYKGLSAMQEENTCSWVIGKVYSNPMAAKMIFKEYDQAKVCAVNEFFTGKSIRDVLRAVRRIKKHECISCLLERNRQYTGNVRGGCKRNRSGGHSMRKADGGKCGRCV